MRRGFTLLEVLIALVIFALSAIVLGSAYLNVLNAYEIVSRSNDDLEDVRFARAQFLAEPDKQKAIDGDSFDTPSGKHARWHATIESTETVDLFQVTFVCELSDTSTKTPPPPVTETFMLLRPTWSDPAENSKLRQAAKDKIADLQGKKR
jgi:general secretion pathway protein I